MCPKAYEHKKYQPFNSGKTFFVSRYMGFVNYYLVTLSP